MTTSTQIRLLNVNRDHVATAIKFAVLKVTEAHPTVFSTKEQHQDVILPRYMFAFIAYDLIQVHTNVQLSTTWIGKHIGRHYTTVIDGLRKFRNKLERDKALESQVSDAARMVGNHLDYLVSEGLIKRAA